MNKEYLQDVETYGIRMANKVWGLKFTYHKLKQHTIKKQIKMMNL